ncbi:MAG TPA: hypothetical protein VHH34_02540, partial [Pseudonocardiaceae bacterium]|nr:hypothetical protein [Pseudonocardiaceae bacterium]
ACPGRHAGRGHYAAGRALVGGVMWQQTERLTAIWLRITLALAAAVAMVATACGTDSGPFIVAVLAAVVLELLTVRALCREWTWQARGTWWRFW